MDKFSIFFIISIIFITTQCFPLPSWKWQSEALEIKYNITVQDVPFLGTLTTIGTIRTYPKKNIVRDDVEFFSLVPNGFVQIDFYNGSNDTFIRYDFVNTEVAEGCYYEKEQENINPFSNNMFRMTELKSTEFNGKDVVTHYSCVMLFLFEKQSCVEDFAVDSFTKAPKTNEEILFYDENIILTIYEIKEVKEIEEELFQIPQEIECKEAPESFLKNSNLRSIIKRD